MTQATGARGWSDAARRALPLWLASRLAVAIVSVAGAWTLGRTRADDVASFTELWDQWDVGIYVKIARFGYFADPESYSDCCTAAFFPGGPLALRAVQLFVPSWIAAGLLISFISGAFAATALYRLGVLEGGDVVGVRAVLYLVVAPYAVFLFAGYTEALFLGFAVPAWFAARERRWRAAGLLAAAGAFVRVTGLFLAIGLLVEFALNRGSRSRADVAWILAPFAVVAGYFGWLYHRTGDWLAWQHAQADGWHREFSSPWRAFMTTYESATEPAAIATYSWSFRAEIIAVLVGVVLTGVLISKHRYGEAAFIATSLFALATSTFYQSTVRAALTWFPLYLLLAQASVRREWVHHAVLWLSAPLMFAMTIAFTMGRWVA